MNLVSIDIDLEGKYIIEKLSKLGFHHEPKHNNWVFDGKLHRYIFQPIREGYLRIMIIKRPDASVRPIPHKITFGNFHDWLMKCVDTIQSRK